MPPEAGIPKEAFTIANVVIFAAILVGVSLNARRKLHTRIMWGCFVADMLMVLVIELTRKAVKQAGEVALRMSERPMLAFHIAVSIATLILWFVQLRSGSRLLRELETAGANAPGAMADAPSRRRHRFGAVSFLVFRAVNLVTSFFV